LQWVEAGTVAIEDEVPMPSLVERRDESSPARSTTRRDGCSGALLPLVMCAPFLVRRIHLLFTPQPIQDFVTYWAAGRLFLTGQDPYSMSAMLGIERSLGWSYAHTLVMLNPPWTLPFVALLALLPFAAAHHAWLAVSLVLEIACALVLWRYFGGEHRQRWIALVVVATFLPAATAEHMGQITPLILVGITGFLVALRRGRYVLAGLCLLLFGLKPHLLYLVLLAILMWSIQMRKWAVLISPALCAVGASLAAVAFNRNVLGYFHETVQAAVDTPCGVGGALRAIFGVQHVWLQFLPSACGLVWFAWYWMRHRAAWRWVERLPLLLLVSIGTAPYFWAHDFMVGLPAIIALAIQVGRARMWILAGAAYLLVQIIIMNTDDGSTKAWIASVSLLWVVLYQVIHRLCAPAQVASDLSPEAG
jgi:hypothetical protein